MLDYVLFIFNLLIKLYNDSRVVDGEFFVFCLLNRVILVVSFSLSFIKDWEGGCERN